MVSNFLGWVLAWKGDPCFSCSNRVFGKGQEHDAASQVSCPSSICPGGQGLAMPDSENCLTSDNRIWLATAPELVHISETTPIGNRYTE